ncbi:MAG TPA: ABC-type transport auxiliary lipoprotein family protein [Steroidobacteraceae bacterium]|nr:ABC-type transport auxiliary lipoprotein family protein [Steroidobacteraceae bacterium]
MRRPRLTRVAPPLAAALAISLAGAGACTNLFHSDAKPEQTYVLRAPAAGAAGAATAGATATAPAAVLGSLQVAHPAAAPGLDGPHIILVQADHRMNFYLGSRWPAPLPDVVEALAVETLRASGDWQSVQDSGSPFPAEYLLSISVRRFEADYSAGRSAPQVEVVLDCTLGGRRGRDLMASFVAAGSAAAAGDRMSEVIAAFETASSTALVSLSAQAAEATRAFAARGATTTAH